VSVEANAVPRGCARAPSQAEKDQPKRHSSEFGALDWWLAAGCAFGACVPASTHPLRTRVARRTRRQPEEGGNIFVTTYPGHVVEYAFLSLAHRIDIDRLYGLLLMVTERSCATCHGSYGDRYNQKTWEHMSPFEIKFDIQPRHL
jgi:hypothetical protein